MRGELITQMAIRDYDKTEYDPEKESDVLIALDVQETDGLQVILYNDEVNSFEFVIESLIKVCKHDPLQAEQCTFLVHYKGKCSVKKGSYEELEPVCTALLERGLTAEIE